MADTFDDLKTKAITAAEEAVKDMAGQDWSNPEFTFDDGLYHAVDGVVPAETDAEWGLKLLASRPELFTFEADGGSIGEAIRNAVRDLIIDEIEETAREFATAAGVLTSDSPSP